MKVKKFKIEGLLEFIPNTYADDRGEFTETYNESVFKSHGLTDPFVQDNQSISHEGVFRGIHLQTGDSAQGKLVRVSKGSVVDFAVDLRLDSKTYGHWQYLVVSAEKGNQFWVPSGFGHAFLALEDDTIFCYKCTKEYDKSSEVCILWSDSDINLTIDRSLLSDNSKPIRVSEKDELGITLSEYTSKMLLLEK